MHDNINVSSTTKHYKLLVIVVGEHGNWYNKMGTKFGSSGNYVSVDKIIIAK